MSQNSSLPLFVEDIYECLKAAVQACGGAKQVAAKLWSHKPIEEARRELLDALNRDRPRKLDPEEVMFILRLARDADFHHALHWLCAELGYDNPQPIEPDTETARLIREFLDCTKRAQQLQPKIEERLRVAK